MRRAWMRSRRKITAPAVANSGAVKLIAVTLGSPVRCSAEKKSSIETSPSTLRRACSGRRPVRSTAGPQTHQDRQSAPASRTGCGRTPPRTDAGSPVSSRIITCMSEKPNAEMPISSIPRSVPGARS